VYLQSGSLDCPHSFAILRYGVKYFFAKASAATPLLASLSGSSDKDEAQYFIGPLSIIDKLIAFDNDA